MSSMGTDTTYGSHVRIGCRFTTVITRLQRAGEILRQSYAIGVLHG